MDLTLDYIKELNLPLGSPVSLSKISGGYSNNNYLFTTDLGVYRLRLPQYSISLSQIEAEQQVLHWAAAKSKYPIPLLCSFLMPDNTPVSVFPYIVADQAFDIHNEKLLYHAGKVLSEYHLAIEGYSGVYPYSSVNSSLNNVNYDVSTILDIAKGEPDADDLNFGAAVEKLYTEIRETGSKMEKGLYSSLPFVVCHGDYAPSNLLSVSDEVVGIIDFENARWESRIYDVAVGLLALEQSEGYESRMYDFFLQGYQSNIKLQQQELELIPRFQCIRTLEAANRHFKRVVSGEVKINAGLTMYWSRII